MKKVQMKKNEKKNEFGLFLVENKKVKVKK